MYFNSSHKLASFLQFLIMVQIFYKAFKANLFSK